MTINPIQHLGITLREVKMITLFNKANFFILSLVFVLSISISKEIRSEPLIWGSKITLSVGTHRAYCLDVVGTNSSQNGANVQLNACDKVTEYWFYDRSNYQIKLARDSEVCLDVKGVNDIQNRQNVQIWDCDGVSEQWVFSDDRGICVRSHPSYCLDVPESSPFEGNGENIFLWKNTGEKWNLATYLQRGAKLTLTTGSSRVYCLDVAGTDTAKNGRNVQLYPCDDVTEHWVYDSNSGEITLGYDSGKCLEVSGTNDINNRQNVRIWDCKAVTERWTVKDNGQICIRSNTNYCLDAAGLPPFNGGENVHLWRDTNETWDFRNYPQNGSKLRVVNGRWSCLDVVGTNSNSNGKNVQVSSCDRVTEHWVYDASTGKITLGYDSEKCLDVSGTNNINNRQNVQIWDCNEVTESWVVQNNGQICISSNTDYCLDVKGNPPYESRGENVHLYNGTREQWSFHSYNRRFDGYHITPWNLHLYGHNNLPNTTSNLNRSLEKVKDFLHWYWEYMPSYLKKHALNGKPKLKVIKHDWDEEVAIGAPMVSTTSSDSALDDFSSWILREYDRSELDINVFIQEGDYGATLGSANVPQPIYFSSASQQFAVSALSYDGALVHEIGHTLSLNHFDSSCELPGQGTFYSIMYSTNNLPSLKFLKMLSSRGAQWAGPLYCQDQDEVLAIFYKMAFSDHLDRWNRHSFEADIIYDANDKALYATDNNNSDFNTLTSDRGANLIVMGFSGIRAGLVVKHQPSQALYPGRFTPALFTVIPHSSGKYQLLPDGPMAYRVLEDSSSTAGQTMSRTINYYRRKP